MATNAVSPVISRVSPQISRPSGEVKSGGTKTVVIVEETKAILAIMIPLMLKFYFSCAAGGMAVAFIGHYDNKPANISGALLGKAYSDLTGLSIGIGITLGLSTCISQNHGRGADNENGLAMKQCRRALLLAMAFSTLCAVFSRPILAALGQPEEVLESCSKTVITNVLALPGFWFSAAVGTTLVSQNIVNASVVADTMSAVLNMVCTYLFLRFGETGYIGAAWANVIAGWVSAAFIFCYVTFTGKQDIVWTVAARSADAPPPISLRKYLTIALPSAFSLWAEWWAGIVLAIFAGWLPEGDMAVGGNGIIGNTLGIFFMTFVATQAATTTRVGNLVGSKSASRIPAAVGTAVVMAALLSGVVSLILQIWGESILALYVDTSADAKGILDEANGAKTGMVATIVPYAVMMCLLGALRGAGLQAWGAVVLAIAFYPIGLPISLYLGLYTPMELNGIRLGNAIALLIAAVAMTFKIMTVNWKKVVADADESGDLTAPLPSS